MPEYKVPIIWETSGMIIVEADNLKEAIRDIIEKDEPMPFGSYIEHSIRLDPGSMEFCNPENKEVKKFLQKRKIKVGPQNIWENTQLCAEVDCPVCNELVIVDDLELNNSVECECTECSAIFYVELRANK